MTMRQVISMIAEGVDKWDFHMPNQRQLKANSNWFQDNVITIENF